MATIRVAVRKRWQTRPYEYEECELAYDEDVEQATLDERARKKGIRVEDAAAELASALHISLSLVADQAMQRGLARADPRDVADQAKDAKELANASFPSAAKATAPTQAEKGSVDPKQAFRTPPAGKRP